MKSKILLSLLSLFFLYACGTQKTTVETAAQKKKEEKLEMLPQHVTQLFTKEELKAWQHKDPMTDKLPGMSVEKAYATVLKKYPAKQTVVVAVLDSGLDIDHEDLKDNIWKNEDEIPGNGIDDDKNGYVDDVYGWNFLGSRDGKNAYKEQMEMTRIVKKYRSQWQDKEEKDIAPENLEMFKLYKRAEKELAEEIKNMKALEGQIKFYKNVLNNDEKLLKDFLKTDTLTKELVKTIKTDDPQLADAKERYLSGFAERIKGGEKYVDTQLNYYLNVDFDGRAVVGDNPDDFNDRDYGNPNVKPVEKDEAHATHVAGIIGAVRNNGIGIDGVADAVKLMAIRAVPDGDEYDKDIALGIRYAVDNGAKIINTSFGKYYSPHKEWVWDAIKYAEQHDVLIVNAAGNDAKDMDKFGEFISYPNDGEKPGEEIASNMITIGASTYHFGARLPAPFSNYGKTTVDLFSPGYKIYSTVPFNDYASFSGTSMAAPDAAGVAALIRSRFPELTAKEVKEILMESGVTPEILVFVPTEDKEKPDIEYFKNLSKSGKLVNAYNALLLAAKKVEEKKNNN